MQVLNAISANTGQPGMVDNSTKKQDVPADFLALLASMLNLPLTNVVQAAQDTPGDNTSDGAVKTFLDQPNMLLALTQDMQQAQGQDKTASVNTQDKAVSVKGEGVIAPIQNGLTANINIPLNVQPNTQPNIPLDVPLDVASPDGLTKNVITAAAADPKAQAFIKENLLNNLVSKGSDKQHDADAKLNLKANVDPQVILNHKGASADLTSGQQFSDSGQSLNQGLPITAASETNQTLKQGNNQTLKPETHFFEVDTGSNSMQVVQPVQTMHVNQPNVPALPDNVIKPADVMEQLISNIKVFTDKKTTQLHIDLQPEFLGKVNLKLSYADGVVTAKLVADNPQVKDIIQTNLPMIRDSLAQNGIRLQSVEVSTFNSFLNGNTDSQGHYQQQQNQQKRNFEKNNYAEGLEKIPEYANGIFTNAVNILA